MLQSILESRYKSIAMTALSAYHLDSATISFIRHSDNVTYKVVDQEKQSYLLRIHIPVTKAMGTHGADVQMINSELLWLEALNKETDLTLQKPVRNRTGHFVTRVPGEEFTMPINCTLLHWVDGGPYHRDLETELTAYQIGELLAKLHNHASKWTIPKGFTRPKRNIPYFTRVLRGIEPAVHDGRIKHSDYAEFARAIELLTTMISNLKESRQTHGLMHADAHKGNMLIDAGKVRIIDFSFCAFGNFMFDLGICLSDMKTHLHHAFLEGYQKVYALPDNHEQWIEGFFIGSIVGTFSFWASNQETHDLLEKKAPHIAREYAAKFNRGEHFWFQ